MGGCGSNDMPISEELSIYCESSGDPPDPSSGHGWQISMNDLAKCFTNSLYIQDDQESICGLVPSTEKNDPLSSMEEDEFSDCHRANVGNPVSQKCLDKWATFPSSTKAFSFTESVDTVKQREDVQTSEVLPKNGLANSAHEPCLRSVSLPTPTKLVSAMKGSREKQGNQPKKLSVKWAPDVYDPPPTSVSHVPMNKPHRHRSDGKKNRKNKQKDGGKSTRGSKGKDKKQSRKHGGSTSRCYKSIADDQREVSSTEPLPSIADFDVGSPDSFCGSSFLKNSVSNLHFSVAEAT